MSGDHKTLVKGNPSQYVKINVGGNLYYTTIGTLTKHDTMLSAMFSGRMEVLTVSEGWILLDRCGKHFGTILNFLRDGSAPLPETQREIAELLAESKYYCIKELADSCERALTKRNREMDQIKTFVPLIENQEEEEFLIANATKPIVKLFMNRHNNKYSYTTASDDNLLKNTELFDKLSLRYGQRIIFIKIIFGSNEICCWSFYGNGSKKAEVCCTSIVYATDRKQTKVEFPEARILEETMAMFLYENRNVPNQDLMQATSSSRGAVAGLSTSDEEEDRTGMGGAKPKTTNKTNKHDLLRNNLV
jgi:BTB/POZ domain-containing adapter for CUL3-mediated RhoA degradation protein